MCGSAGCSAGTEVSGGGWLAVGAEGSVYTSTEGEVWDSHASGVTMDLLDVAVSDVGNFVAVGDFGVMQSEDGHAWIEVTDATTSIVAFHSAVFAGGRFTIAGNYISAAPPPNNVAPRVFVLEDADVWTELPAPSGSSLTSLAPTEFGLLAATRIDAPESLVRISRYDHDAEKWSSEWTSNAHAVQAFSDTTGRYAVGDCTVLEASDTTWLDIYAAGRCETPRGAAIADTETGAVVVTSRYALRFDGDAWTTQELPPGTWRDVAHVDGKLVMVGGTDEHGGQVAISDDGGASWQTTASTPHALFAVVSPVR